MADTTEQVKDDDDRHALLIELWVYEFTDDIWKVLYEWQQAHSSSEALDASSAIVLKPVVQRHDGWLIVKRKTRIQQDKDEPDAQGFVDAANGLLRFRLPNQVECTGKTTTLISEANGSVQEELVRGVIEQIRNDRDSGPPKLVGGPLGEGQPSIWSWSGVLNQDEAISGTSDSKPASTHWLFVLAHPRAHEFDGARIVRVVFGMDRGVLAHCRSWPISIPGIVSTQARACKQFCVAPLRAFVSCS